MRFIRPRIYTSTSFFAGFRSSVRAGLIVGNAAIALSLSSCTSAVSPSASSEESTDPALQVVTTFLPITYFTEAVAGDRATVTQLLPLTVDPHDYQAKPSDVQSLADADVLVENGLELESFLDSLINSADNPELVMIDSSEGVETISNAENADGHDHESHDHESHDHESHDHDHGDEDPHVWLDPKNAIQQVENIRDGLIAADLEGEEIYTANAAAYIAELEALDQAITKQLAPYAGMAFVTYHDFAAYFAQSYGLEAEHLISLPDGSPAPADVQRVIDTVKSAGLQVLLSEPAQSGNAFEAIASDVDVSVSEFDPMETTEAIDPDPADYLDSMSSNADNLAAALEEASL